MTGLRTDRHEVSSLSGPKKPPFTLSVVLKKSKPSRHVRAAGLGLIRTQREMIESCSRVCQLIGLPRSVGQIYGLLYLSVEPQSLDDTARILGISKASASTGTRQLMSWGAIKRVWVHGDRRDYFEAVLDFGALIRRSYADFVKPKLLASGQKLKTISDRLEEDRSAGLVNDDAYKLYVERLKSLSRIQRKVETALPLAEQFL